MNSVNDVQVLNEAICILLNATILGEAMNATILALAMRKYLGWLC